MHVFCAGTGKMSEVEKNVPRCQEVQLRGDNAKMCRRPLMGKREWDMEKKKTGWERENQRRADNKTQGSRAAVKSIFFSSLSTVTCRSPANSGHWKGGRRDSSNGKRKKRETTKERV